MYDLLIVGAGITAATLVAALKKRLRICVIDCRQHFGGNCFDESENGTLIHRYGPHIFHCPSPRIVSFLDRFTQWIPYTHQVLAEIQVGDELQVVPFPYSAATERSLGYKLNEADILEKFFRGYSQKMWGMPWESLPASVRGRIPRDISEEPVYYRDRFVALPRRGYSHMIANMFDGVEIILGAPATEWTRIAAKSVIYTGRPDLIPVPGENANVGERENLHLGFRTLDITFADEPWPLQATSLHACTVERHWTRKTCFARMTGGESKIVSTETPRQAGNNEVTPYYPMETASNQDCFALLTQKIKELYPALHLAGRLGTYRYFDMYQAVGQGLALADQLWKK